MEIVRYVSTKSISASFQIVSKKILEKVPFDRVDDLKGGFEHFLFVSKGQIFALGSNAYGQTGLKGSNGLKLILEAFSGNDDYAEEPTPVEYFENKTQQSRSDWIANVECGNYHSACLSQKGKVLNWGGNFLGNGRLENTCQPLVVPFEEPIRMIKAGGNYTVAISQCNKIYIWGGIPGLIQTGPSFHPALNYCLAVPVQLNDCKVSQESHLLCTDHGISIFNPKEFSFESLVPKQLIAYSMPKGYPINPFDMQIIPPSSFDAICHRHLYKKRIKLKNNSWTLLKIIPSASCPQTFFMLTKEFKLVIIDANRSLATELDGLYRDVFSFCFSTLLLHLDGKQVFALEMTSNQWQLKKIHQLERESYSIALSRNMFVGLFKS